MNMKIHGIDASYRLYRNPYKPLLRRTLPRGARALIATSFRSHNSSLHAIDKDIKRSRLLSIIFSYDFPSPSPSLFITPHACYTPPVPDREVPTHKHPPHLNILLLPSCLTCMKKIKVASCKISDSDQLSMNNQDCEIFLASSFLINYK